MKISIPLFFLVFGWFSMITSIDAQKNGLAINTFGPPTCKDTQYTLLPTACNISFTIVKPTLNSCTGNADFQLSGDLGSNYIQTNIPTGIYQVTHTITDTCGGKYTCNSAIIIKDVNKPNPNCYPFYLGALHNN